MSKNKQKLHFDRIQYDSDKNEFVLSTVQSKRITKEVLDQAVELLGVISEVVGESIESILGKGRKRELINARSNFIALIKKASPKLGYVDIGSFFEGERPPKGKDHAMILHGFRNHYNLMDFDKHYKDINRQIRMGWDDGWLTDQEIGDYLFSLSEVKMILIKNGVTNPLFTKRMFSLRFLENSRELETAS